LKTLSLVIFPKPADVAYKLLSAYLISPSAVKIKAPYPYSSISNFSASQTSFNLFNISSSLSFVNLTIAHLD
jgi:hypothetical protein